MSGLGKKGFGGTITAGEAVNIMVKHTHFSIIPGGKLPQYYLNLEMLI